MNITKDIQRLEKSSVKLSITIGKDDVRSEYDELLASYSKTIQIPGFRRGKVPHDVLVRKHGDALKGEAVSKIIEKALVEVFREESLTRETKPLSTPRLEEVPKPDLENDLKFSFVYDVFPEVKVDKWQGFEAEIPDVSIGDEDINRELEAIRERNSFVLDKNDGESAESGDVLTVNYCELDDAGEVLASSEREDFTFTLGSSNNIYQFDDEVTGMKKGETKEFSKTYPEDHKDHPGKTKKLKVTLTALKTKKLPELDDDFAQDVDEKYKTLDDLKNNIRDRLNKDLEQRLRDVKVNKLIEKIAEHTPVEIPESMMRVELDARWQNLAMRLNTDAKGLYNMIGNERAELAIEEWRPEVAKSIHSRLIVETLIEELKIDVNDDEVEKELERLAKESETSIEDVKKYYEEGQIMEYLREDTKRRRFFDILLEKNTVNSGEKKSYIDLVSNNV